MSNPQVILTTQANPIGVKPPTLAAVTAAALTNSTGETPAVTIDDVSTPVTGVDGTADNAASKADVDTRLAAINQNHSNLADQVNKLLADNAALRAHLVSLGVGSA